MIPQQMEGELPTVPAPLVLSYVACAGRICVSG